MVAVMLLASCADQGAPRSGRPPSTDPAGVPTTAPTTLGTEPTMSTTTATAAAVSPATPPTDLDIQSSDEQRCAIAAEAGVDLAGCPG